MGATKPNDGTALRALITSALALPGLAVFPGVAHASSDDIVRNIEEPAPPAEALSGFADQGDGSTEFSVQRSHYRETQRNQLGVAPVGSIVATPGATTTGTLYGVVPAAGAVGVHADGEHVTGRFRLGDRHRAGFDFVQDVWSGASPMATVPVSTLGSASIARPSSSYFTSQGVPAYLAQYQQNLAGSPVREGFAASNQITHVMGSASPESRNQSTLRYGYDGDDYATDISAGVSSENDFLARFGNLSLRRDFNDKRTSVSAGLSLTRGNTHAEWLAEPNLNNFATDAYPGAFSQYRAAGFGSGQPILTRLITGARTDEALTAGVTQVLGRNDLASVGFGLTRTSGYLGNPYKGALVFLPAAPDPIALAFNPTLSFYSGNLELERRPSLRNQLTGDASLIHYLDGWNAAAQVHYSLFLDSWGIAAHTLDAEWRQQFGGRWTVTPRARYYSQKAARFYAPYFFAGSVQQLAGQSFSSDERLAAFGTVSAGIVIDYRILQHLSAEFSWEADRRSGRFKLGGNGAGSYADLDASVFSLSLRGAIDGAALASAAMQAAHHHHGNAPDLPAGVMGAHFMAEPGAWMIGYTLERDTQAGSYLQGSTPVATQPAFRATSMTMQMQMLELMVAQKPWLDWMLMPQVMSGSMGMWMSMGSMSGMSNFHARSFMEMGGAGDTAFGASLRLWSAGTHEIHTQQLLSAPTGSVKQWDLATNHPQPYDMQNGSGTWDYQPSVTYTGSHANWSWGAQASGAWRLQSRNGDGYALGAHQQADAWGSLRLVPGLLDATARVRVANQDPVRGGYPASFFVRYANLMEMNTPDRDAGNYGGHFRDLALGLSASLAGIAGPGDRIALEHSRPMHTNDNGLQLDRAASWVLNLRIMF